jgi:predicted AAA+ superfamily ATPase
MLRRWRDRQVIKVITGVRRCGKSTLLTLFQRELLAEGVPAANIIALAMDDLANAELVTNHKNLHDYIIENLAPTGTTYVFLDEVQLVEHYERMADSLLLRANIDLYITGSNASLLSGELATLLSGRYVELSLLPLSFAEFVTGRRQQNPDDLSLTALYTEYIRYGSFPFVLNLIPDAVAVSDYLNGILDTVLLKDVVIRQQVSTAAALEDVVRFLFHNIGNLTSLRRVSAGLESAGRSPSSTTIDKYISGLTSAYLCYPARRWDVKGLRYLTGSEKYYVVDPGLRAALVGFTGSDTGHILENIVFLELVRRNGKVRVGAVASGEIDFVVGDGADTVYYQVCETLRDPATLARELKPLLALRDHHPKYLLTLDQNPPISHDGILQISCLDWLMAQP